MSKIKLLHIQLLPLLSGVQNMMLELLKNLDREKYEIFVMSKPGGPLVEAVREAGYRHLPVNSLRRELSLWDIAAFLEIYKLIKKYRFDIIHTHSSKTGFLGRLAGKLTGTRKIIHTVHGFAIHEHQSGISNLLYMFLEKTAAGFCDQVVFVNKFERQFALSKKIVKAENSRTIYNAVNYKNFDTPKRDYSENRDYKENPFIIGSVLRFTAQKNTLNTIKAAIRVCRIKEYISFIFIGDGNEYIKCKELIEKEKLNKRIILTGWQQEINKLLVRLDAFLLYSRWEGLPISILEAMASGLPVVCSDIKGNNELVDDTNGILIEIDNEDALVNTLINLPERHDDLQIWSHNSRLIAENNFSLKQFIGQYRELYEY